MVSIGRICVVIIPLTLSLAAIVLGALACAGSAKNSSAVNGIYEFQLDMSKIDITKVISDTTILGAFTSLSGVTVSGSDIGLSDMYTIGQWGYCKGDYTNDEYKPSYCSDPKAMYIFDPIQLLVDDLSNGKLDITTDDLDLPEGVKDKRSLLKIASRAIFITTIIGIAASALTFLFTIASFWSHLVSCIANVFASIAFIGYIIAAALSTATFIKIKEEFNDAYNEYGIKTSFGNNKFYGLIWASAGIMLIVAILELFAICCGKVKSKKSKAASYEKEPVMGYEERQVV